MYFLFSVRISVLRNYSVFNKVIAVSVLMKGGGASGTQHKVVSVRENDTITSSVPAAPPHHHKTVLFVFFFFVVHTSLPHGVRNPNVILVGQDWRPTNHQRHCAVTLTHTRSAGRWADSGLDYAEPGLSFCWGQTPEVASLPLYWPLHLRADRNNQQNEPLPTIQHWKWPFLNKKKL